MSDTATKTKVVAQYTGDGTTMKAEVHIHDLATPPNLLVGGSSENGCTLAQVAETVLLTLEGRARDARKKLEAMQLVKPGSTASLAPVPGASNALRFDPGAVAADRESQARDTVGHVAAATLPGSSDGWRGMHGQITSDDHAAALKTYGSTEVAVPLKDLAQYGADQFAIDLASMVLQPPTVGLSATNAKCVASDYFKGWAEAVSAKRALSNLRKQTAEAFEEAGRIAMKTIEDLKRQHAAELAAARSGFVEAREQHNVEIREARAACERMRVERDTHSKEKRDLAEKYNAQTAELVRVSKAHDATCAEWNGAYNRSREMLGCRDKETVLDGVRSIVAERDQLKAKLGAQEAHAMQLARQVAQQSQTVAQLQSEVDAAKGQGHGDHPKYGPLGSERIRAHPYRSRDGYRMKTTEYRRVDDAGNHLVTTIDEEIAPTPLVKPTIVPTPPPANGPVGSTDRPWPFQSFRFQR